MTASQPAEPILTGSENGSYGAILLKNSDAPRKSASTGNIGVAIELRVDRL